MPQSVKEAGGPERRRKMRRVILFSLVALGALAVGAYALAGSPSQGMRAFALVDPNGACPSSSPQCGSPALVDAHTNGFVDVSQGAVGPGDYCLTPAPGVDVTNTAAVASEEAFYSNAFGFVTVRYQPNSPNCNANRLEVKTFALGDGLSNQIAFTVNVP
jgi:hypothetical protein